MPIALTKLNIGCGKTLMEAPWVNLDKESMPGVDYVYDLDNCGVHPTRIRQPILWSDPIGGVLENVETKLPFEDDFFEEMLMSHILEHLKNPLAVMQELHRIARPDALLTVRVPYGSSDAAWEDPQHVRPYFLQSFEYFGQPCYWRADYGYRGDWQVTSRTLVVNENAPFVKGIEDLAQLMELVMHARNVVLELYVELRAVKPIREMKRELGKASPIQFTMVKGE